uniref:TRAFtype zinc finger domain containing 1 [Dasypus novemcinctus] n=1 Tax=Lepeophtheirus salmonis TaxID=72036 RepID=A0A0K2VBH5_LEPSM
MYKLTERTHGYSRETRSSKEYKSQTLPRTSNISNLSSDANTLLPCEFCEEMVPMFKLLEHQAECVNPSNVRGGNSNNPAIIRSHSMYTTGTSSSSNNSNINKRYGTDNTEVVLRRKLNSSNRYDSYDSRKDSSIDDNEEYLPCEFCGQSFLPDYIMKHQMSCDQNPHPSKFPSRRASSYLSPSSSINREGRACTEDRQLRPLGGSLSRQGSFTTSSRQRRGESLTRQSSFSRNYLSQRSSYDYTSPSASSIRRASIFDGYSGFAIYSSISQGLDEITYGGRRSRRNSITESSYTRTSDNSFALPTLLAMQTASGATPTTPVSPNPRSNSSASNNNSNNSDPFRFPSSSSSSTEYRSSIVRRDSENSSHHKNSPTVKRNVSFTGEKPVVINDTPPHSQVTENVGNEEKRIAMERSIEREKKKEPSPHLNLFDEINDKLKLLEVEQQQKEQEQCLQIRHSLKKDFVLDPTPTSSLFPMKYDNEKEESKAPPVPPRRDSLQKEVHLSPVVSYSHRIDEEIYSYPPSPMKKPDVHPLYLSSSESSQNSKPLNSSSITLNLVGPSSKNEIPLTPNSTTISTTISHSNKAQTSLSQSPPTPPTKELTLPPPSLDPQTSVAQTLKDVTNEIELRQKNGGSKTGSRAGSKSGSKAGSKRNSLDSKTVQGLAQDLAAECAKAYALMESSLSKLSTDFSVAPFGISPKKKSLRKTRAHSTLK